MRLLQDGVVAALAAIGLTTIIFLFLSAIVHPRRRDALPATAVVEDCGDGRARVSPLRSLLLSLSENGGFTRGGSVDSGLSEEPRCAAELLCRSEYEVYLCKKEELTDFFT